MSLETDIQQLTKAVLALTYALNQPQAYAVKGFAPADPAKEKAEVKKPVAVAAPTSPEKPAKDATVTETSSPNTSAILRTKG